MIVVGNISLSNTSVIVVSQNGSLEATGCVNISGNINLQLSSIPANGTILTLVTSDANCLQYLGPLLINASDPTQSCVRISTQAQTTSSSTLSVLMSSDSSQCGSNSSSGGIQWWVYLVIALGIVALVAVVVVAVVLYIKRRDVRWASSRRLHVANRVDTT